MERGPALVRRVFHQESKMMRLHLDWREYDPLLDEVYNCDVIWKLSR